MFTGGVSVVMLTNKSSKLIMWPSHSRLFKPAALARCALVMAATLACYGVALAVEHWEHQHVDLVVTDGGEQVLKPRPAFAVVGADVVVAVDPDDLGVLQHGELATQLLLARDAEAVTLLICGDAGVNRGAGWRGHTVILRHITRTYQVRWHDPPITSRSP